MPKYCMQVSTSGYLCHAYWGARARELHPPDAAVKKMRALLPNTDPDDLDFSLDTAPLILEKTGCEGLFDAVAEGNGISRSKPDLEVLLLAARLLNIEPRRCAVVEDAFAGILAAKAAGMETIGGGERTD